MNAFITPDQEHGSAEDIQKVLGEHFVMHHWIRKPEESPLPIGEWRCSCKKKFGFSDSAIKHQAEEIVKALAA